MLTSREPQLYALLRIVTGFLFLWHGLGKLAGFPSPPPPEAPAFIIWVAGPIELFGGLLVMLGLFTRPAAFLCSGLMAAAYWMAHGLRHPLPVVNQGELAVLYCFAFLYMAARGSGRWSVDGMRRGSPASARPPGRRHISRPRRPRCPGWPSRRAAARRAGARPARG